MMANLIVGAVILVVVFFAGRSVYKSYKKTGCACGCSGCGEKSDSGKSGCCH